MTYTLAMMFDSVQIVVYGLGIARGMLLFMWPLLLLTPLRGRHPFDPNRYLAIWVMLALFWFAGVALPDSAKLGFTLIPEPFNLLAFLASGALVGMFAALARVMPRRRI